MTREDIQLLYGYDRWANNRVLQAATALTAEAFTRDLGGSFCSVLDTLVHIIGGSGFGLCRNSIQLRVTHGSPSSPTEGLKISMFPGKRHTIKHLEFQPFRLLTEGLQVRVLPGEPLLKNSIWGNSRFVLLLVSGVCIRKHVKGLLETDRQLPVLPEAVRKYKIQKSSFLTRFLLLEQLGRPLRKFKKPNPFL
jgi:DinB family